VRSERHLRNLGVGSHQSRQPVMLHEQIAARDGEQECVDAHVLVHHQRGRLNHTS